MAEKTTTDISSFLDEHENKTLLRFITCGSVDDGKSTLIGRLLFDSKLIYDDQLSSLQDVSERNGTVGAGEIDYALLLDGLKAEREQGITIDVAYRYFSTPQRKFIIADTPGHEQYTRNMATGASTADLAIILIDARYGVVTQTRRHAFITSLLGIKHLIVAVNKMDIGGYQKSTFDEIRQTFSEFATHLDGSDIRYVPISALKGTNVVGRSPELTPWYDGPSLLELLETVDLSQDINTRDFRFPVQVVIRPHLDFRGFAGSVVSGAVHPGDAVRVLPSYKTSTVKRIVTADGDLPEAFAPQAVTLELTDEVDISSGDMLVREGHLPQVSDRFEATVIWMSEQPLRAHVPYWVRHAGRFVKAQIAAVREAIDVNTLAHVPADTLSLNGIGHVIVETTHPLYLDTYKDNRATGNLIFVDPISNVTAGAALVTRVLPSSERNRTAHSDAHKDGGDRYAGLETAFGEFLRGTLTAKALKSIAAPFGIAPQRDTTFTLRVRVTGGRLATDTLAQLADAVRASRGFAHLTSRQAIELHDVPADRVIATVRTIDRLGFPFLGNGGNTAPNVVVGSDSGVSADTVFDVTPYAEALHRALSADEGHPARPHALSIGFFARASDQQQAAAQDLGFLAKLRDGERGFAVYVAGGRGRTRGIPLFSFLPSAQIVRATQALVLLLAPYTSRADGQQVDMHALLSQLGEADFLRHYLDAFARTEAAAVTVADDAQLETAAARLPKGRKPQKALPGFAPWTQSAVSPTRFGDAVRSVRLYVPEGRLTADALRKIAALAVEAGSPQIRLLATQDILLPLAHVSVLPKLYRHLTEQFGDIDPTILSARRHKKTSRVRNHPERANGGT